MHRCYRESKHALDSGEVTPEEQLTGRRSDTASRLKTGAHGATGPPRAAPDRAAVLKVSAHKGAFPGSLGSPRGMRMGLELPHSVPGPGAVLWRLQAKLTVKRWRDW